MNLLQSIALLGVMTVLAGLSASQALEFSHTHQSLALQWAAAAGMGSLAYAIAAGVWVGRSGSDD
jgi:hypothetical protein